VTASSVARATSPARRSGAPPVDESRVPTQRDLQKQATRETLRTSALQLFVEQGFRETTAEEIAAAAGVSRRTFFLHFASKDEVLLGHIAEDLAMLRAELDTSPASLAPAARAGHAVTQLASSIQQRDNLLLQLDLLHKAPELLAVNLKQFSAFETAIADAVRTWIAGPRQRRLTSDEDVFAELVGTVSMAALRAGLNVWRRRAGRGQLHRLVAANVQRLADGLNTP
jgi:AcrR family transcriptional regulator